MVFDGFLYLVLLYRIFFRNDLVLLIAKVCDLNYAGDNAVCYSLKRQQGCGTNNLSTKRYTDPNVMKRKLIKVVSSIYGFQKVLKREE